MTEPHILAIRKERRAAINDIKRKVRQLMRESTARAMKRIEKLEYENTICIAADHIDDRQSWRVPKNLICALAQIMAGPSEYGPLSESKKDRAKINFYKEHM